MIPKAIKNGAWEEVPPKANVSGAWEEVQSIKQYIDEAWTETWSASKYKFNRVTYTSTEALRPGKVIMNSEARVDTSGNPYYFLSVEQNDYYASWSWTLHLNEPISSGTVVEVYVHKYPIEGNDGYGYAACELTIGSASTKGSNTYMGGGTSSDATNTLKLTGSETNQDVSFTMKQMQSIDDEYCTIGWDVWVKIDGKYVPFTVDTVLSNIN